MISQLRPQYVYNLSNYKKTLEQRNKYLKQENRQEAMLEIWDQKLADFGFNIYTYRREFVDKLISKVKDIHKNITNEEIRIEYSSDCEDKEEYLAHLKRNRHIDFAREYTSCGVHRDDFKTYLDDKEIGTFGSQGQNRTAVLSLKLSEIEVINDEIGEYPILLLDDFMSELDQTRIRKFLGSVQDIQVIITCNNKIDIENSQLFEVKEGKVETT
jgi:DNA replication and repair protein RecF